MGWTISRFPHVMQQSSGSLFSFHDNSFSQQPTTEDFVVFAYNSATAGESRRCPPLGGGSAPK